MKSLLLKLAVFVAIMCVCLTGPIVLKHPAVANDFIWPTSGNWTIMNTDGSGPPDCPGGPGDGNNWRDVVTTYYAMNDTYLFLRMCTYGPAGWPVAAVLGARYKWWFDTQGSALSIGGTTVYNAEFLIMLEDLVNNISGNSTRDLLGELTLMDDLGNVGFTSRWDTVNPPRYVTSNVPSDNIASPWWQRTLGTGNPGTGGPQHATDNPNIGYQIGVSATCNFVDIYVSWEALGYPESLCLVWGTDNQDKGLDQAPNCDRPSTTTCGFEPPPPELDFGDAPDPYYSTNLSNNGPRHVLGSIWLGQLIDAESDGQPINLDDVNGVDDEDGVEFLGAGPPYTGTFNAGENGSVNVTINGTLTDMVYLHGWIDWNQDGDWDDPSENVTNTAFASTGEYTLFFPVPAEALPGTTWARFRLDDENLNSVTGQARNGEVEDYPVTVNAPEAELSLDKTYVLWVDYNGNTLPDPGDIIRYTVTYCNLSDSDLTGVYLEDDYDETAFANINVVSTGYFGSYADNTSVIRWPSGSSGITLNGNTCSNVTYDATLNSKFPAGATTVVNVTTIYSNETDPITDSEKVEVLANPILSIDKTWQDLNGGEVEPGDVILYTIYFENRGNADATEVFLTDQYSEYIVSVSDVTLDTIFADYTDSGSSLRWPSVGTTTLSVNTTDFVSYRATLADDFPEGLTDVINTVSIFCRETGTVEDSETFTVGYLPSSSIVVGITIYPMDTPGFLLRCLLPLSAIVIGTLLIACIKREFP